MVVGGFMVSQVAAAVDAGVGAAVDAAELLSYATMVIRFLLPALAIIIIVRCVRSLLVKRGEAETWGYLSLPNGSRIELNHWENVIGRGKMSDAYMEYPTLSRNHAAIMRDAKGNWRIFDAESMAGVIVNGSKIDKNNGARVKTGDVIDLGGVKLVFVASKDKEKGKNRLSQLTGSNKKNQQTGTQEPGSRSSDGGDACPPLMYSPAGTLAFLTVFQLLLGSQLCISKGESLSAVLPLCFLALIALMWISYAISRKMRCFAFEIETLAFFLCSIGFAVIASGSQAELARQSGLLAMGICLFFMMSWFLRDLDRVNKLRIPIAAAGLVLLAVNVIFAGSVFGARRWLVIGDVSFQPSEIVKIAFIFAGAATMEHLLKKRNLYFFVGFAAICVIALTLITDFGSALIFFVAYLVIAYMRSGDFATIILSVVGAGFAGVMALQFRAHIASRFATWGNAWELSDTGGFQQARAMAAAASGGLFGVGAGNGWFKNIFAADTDLVFGVMAEELGLIMAVAAICSILAFAVYSVWTAGESRSSFYVIAACAAASILVIQMMLNVFGSVDILPFTGVTFPFVSKGGTSLISCWGLIAFIKAADTRVSG